MYQIVTETANTQGVANFATEEAMWNELAYQGVPRTVFGTGAYDWPGGYRKLTWGPVEAEYDRTAAPEQPGVFLVSVGTYEDERVIGVASSRAEAEAMVRKAMNSVAWGALAKDGVYIEGPYKFGELAAED